MRPSPSLLRAATLAVTLVATLAVASAPERAAGKLVVLDLPAEAPARGLFVGPRWRGADAVALVVLDRVGAEATARLREGRPVPDSAPNPYAFPILWVTRAAAAALL